MSLSTRIQIGLLVGLKICDYPYRWYSLALGEGPSLTCTSSTFVQALVCCLEMVLSEQVSEGEKNGSESRIG